MCLTFSLARVLRTVGASACLVIAAGVPAFSQGFRVTEVSLSATPSKHQGACPVQVRFSGKISANAGGVVRYTFLRSDNATGPVETLVFEKAGTKEGSTTWTLGGPSLPKYEGWQALRIVAPNQMVSKNAHFSVACLGAGPQPGKQEDEDKLLRQLPLAKFVVDPALKPAVAEVPGFGGSAPRRLASVADGRAKADFVEDELILMTDDRAALDAFVARWRGRLLATTDFGSAGLRDLPQWHLVRIDPAAADPSTLAADLRALGSTGQGEHRVSSGAAQRLLAAAAGEVRRRGLTVGVNWVIYGYDFLRRRTQETAHSSEARQPWNPNAFTWPYMNEGSAQDIGVGEAWRALSLAGRLGNRVRMAVLDGGFQRMPDTPAGELIQSPLYGESRRPATNPYPCSGGAMCPWHGTDVVSAGMGLVDNGRGAAGPAGPVADLVMVENPAPDIFILVNGISNLLRGLAARPRIVNISSGGAIPQGLAVVPGTLLSAFTGSLRAAGILIFASAGNEGVDVDRNDAVFPWEAEWFMPAECEGVIAVGGMAWDSSMRHASSNSGSNFGRELGTVDIFGPFTVWVGNNPSDRVPFSGETTAKLIDGTSFASPFVAGVAALIWAADPTLSADTVEGILMGTAHRAAAPGDVPRWVDAHAAVTRALGFTPPANFPPQIRIVTPRDGATVDLNRGVSFFAEASDREDGRPNVSWTNGATVRNGVSASFRFNTLGAVTVRATAIDREGASSTASVRVNVVNSPPVARIDAPAAGATVYRGVPVRLQGYATDINEGLEHEGDRLPGSQLTWASDRPGDFAPRAGGEAEVTFPSAGSRTITLTARDTQGLTGRASVMVNVLERPAALPPSVSITGPANRTMFTDSYSVVPLRGAATTDTGRPFRSVVWYAEWDFGRGPQRREIARDRLSVDWQPAGSGVNCGGIDVPITIRLVVTDANGVSSEARTIVVLQCAPV